MGCDCRYSIDCLLSSVISNYYINGTKLDRNKVGEIAEIFIRDIWVLEQSVYEG